MGKNILI